MTGIVSQSVKQILNIAPWQNHTHNWGFDRKKKKKKDDGVDVNTP